jgi:hypothetical protein
LVHLGHTIVHGDESDAKFVFHGCAQDYTVNLDGSGMPHRHGPVFRPVRGGSIALRIAPYIHNEKPRCLECRYAEQPANGMSFRQISDNIRPA